MNNLEKAWIEDEWLEIKKCLRDGGYRKREDFDYFSVDEGDEIFYLPWYSHGVFWGYNVYINDKDHLIETLEYEINAMKLCSELRKRPF